MLLHSYYKKTHTIILTTYLPLACLGLRDHFMRFLNNLILVYLIREDDLRIQSSNYKLNKVIRVYSMSEKHFPFLKCLGWSVVPWSSWIASSDYFWLLSPNLAIQYHLWQCSILLRIKQKNFLAIRKRSAKRCLGCHKSTKIA